MDESSSLGAARKGEEEVETKQNSSHQKSPEKLKQDGLNSQFELLDYLTIIMDPICQTRLLWGATQLAYRIRDGDFEKIAKLLSGHSC